MTASLICSERARRRRRGRVARFDADGDRLLGAQSLIRDAEIEDTLRVYTDAAARSRRAASPTTCTSTSSTTTSLNAFVSGGQNIFIHTGLIIAAENPNEIIGVLAHETGHIAGGHLARSREAHEPVACAQR